MARRSLYQKTLWLTLLLILLVGGIYLVLEASREPLRHLAEITRRIEAIAQTFNLAPQVTVDHKTVLQGSAPALELVAHKQRFEHTMKWSSRWLGSSNEIQIRGVLTASAGFDLKEPLQIEIDTVSQKVIIRHPKPKILSVQIESITTTEDQYRWNRITDENRSALLSQFTQEARTRLEAEGEILENTRRDLRQQLTETLAPYWPSIEFIEEGPSPKPNRL